MSKAEGVNNGERHAEAGVTGRRRLFDKAGAAEYLDASVDTIERLIQAGELAVVKLPVERAKKTGRGRPGVCRRVHIDVRDLDELIERSKEGRRPANHGA